MVVCMSCYDAGAQQERIIPVFTGFDPQMPWNALHGHGMNGKSNEIKEEILNEGTIVRERYLTL